MYFHQPFLFPMIDNNPIKEITILQPISKGCSILLNFFIIPKHLLKINPIY